MKVPSESTISQYLTKKCSGPHLSQSRKYEIWAKLGPVLRIFFSCSRGPILTPGVPNSSSFKSRWQIPNLRHLRHHQRVENPGGIPKSACHKLEMDLAWSTGYSVLESDPILSKFTNLHNLQCYTQLRPQVRNGLSLKYRVLCSRVWPHLVQVHQFTQLTVLHTAKTTS